MAKTFGVIEKNPTTRIEVRSNTFKDKDSLHIREYFLPDGQTEWLPTKRGIALSEACQLEELIPMLQAALDEHAV